MKARQLTNSKSLTPWSPNTATKHSWLRRSTCGKRCGSSSTALAPRERHAAFWNVDACLHSPAFRLAVGLTVTLFPSLVRPPVPLKFMTSMKGVDEIQVWGVGNADVVSERLQVEQRYERSSKYGFSSAPSRARLPTSNRSLLHDSPSFHPFCRASEHRLFPRAPLELPKRITSFHP